jgi:hypothetical protein
MPKKYTESILRVWNLLGMLVHHQVLQLLVENLLHFANVQLHFLHALRLFAEYFERRRVSGLEFIEFARDGFELRFNFVNALIFLRHLDQSIRQVILNDNDYV